MSQSVIEQVEISIAEAKKLVERGAMVKRLSTNPDFKALVMDGYFVDEAARLAHLSSDPGLPENIRECVVRDLAGPGGFKRYLTTIARMADAAENEIEESRETLEELREEELMDDQLDDETEE